MQKLLLIYPHNPFDKSFGANARILEILKSISQTYEIHLLAENNFHTDWSLYEDDNGLVSRLFLHDFESKTVKLKKQLKILSKRLFPLLYHRIKRIKNTDTLELPSFQKTYLTEFPNYSSKTTFKLISKICQEHQYDVVIVGYIFWAELILSKSFINTRKIILIEDFQTSQLLYKHSGLYSLGKIFEKEISLISLFNDAICVSNHEKWLFSQFCINTNFHFIPHFLDTSFTNIQSFKFDLLFVGSDNPFNVDSIKWFLLNVWPLLEKNTTMLIVGKVSLHVSNVEGVTKFSQLNDIAPAYLESKVAICPMLAGTGMKIKVIEALSYGKPVVCTYRSLDGFPDFQDNGCILSENHKEFADNIKMLLTDNFFYSRTSEQAKSYFTKNFSKEAVNPKLQKIFSGYADIV